MDKDKIKQIIAMAFDSGASYQTGIYENGPLQSPQYSECLSDITEKILDEIN